MCIAEVPLCITGTPGWLCLKPHGHYTPIRTPGKPCTPELANLTARRGPQRPRFFPHFPAPPAPFAPILCMSALPVLTASRWLPPLRASHPHGVALHSGEGAVCPGQGAPSRMMLPLMGGEPSPRGPPETSGEPLAGTGSPVQPTSKEEGEDGDRLHRSCPSWWAWRGSNRSGVRSHRRRPCHREVPVCWVPAASARVGCPLAYLGTPWKERRDRSVLRGWPPRVRPSMPHGRGSHPLLPPLAWRV